MTQSPPAIVVDPSPLAARGRSLAGEYLLLNIGVFACSTSVLFLKAATSHPMVVAGMRLLIAAIVLTPVMLIDVRRSKQVGVLSAKQLWRSIPGALLLALHFILWATGARQAPVANATLIVNLGPIALPFTMWMVNSERITRGEIIGTVIAMGGVIALMGQNFQTGDGTFRGDVICFAAMVVFCLYIAIGRRAGQGRSLWAYVVPMYAMAGVCCLTAAAVAGAKFPVLTGAEVGRWIGLGLVPTVIGHSIFNHSIKHLRGQTISTINLAQFAYAAVLGWVIFSEVPPMKMYAVMAVILVGVVVVIRSKPAPAAVPEE